MPTVSQVLDLRPQYRQFRHNEDMTEVAYAVFEQVARTAIAGDPEIEDALAEMQTAAAYNRGIDFRNAADLLCEAAQRRGWTIHWEDNS